MPLANYGESTINNVPQHPTPGYGGTILNAILPKDMEALRTLRFLGPEHLQIGLDECGNTALHIVSALDWTEGVDALLNWGHDDMSPSDQICVSSTVPKHSIDVDIQNSQGSTAVHFAGLQGHRKSLKRLLEHGASRSIQDKTGCTVLHAVASRLDPVLDASFPVKTLEVLKLLLELDHGDRIDLLAKPDNVGRTALHVACQFGNKAVVHELCSHGADVNASDYAGMLPLHVAAQWGRSEVAGVLFNFGAQPNLKGWSGWSELHWMSYHCGSEPTARVLLENGSKVDIQDIFGSTALHIASEKGFESIVELLLWHGASAKVRDYQEMQPFDRTCNRRIRYILLSPLGSRNDEFEILREAIKSGRESGIDEAIDNVSSGIDAQDHQGDTALHYAVLHGDYSVVTRCLLKGASPNTSNNKGQTVLHLAVAKGDDRIIKLLCHYRADPLEEDKEGRSPLLWAVCLDRWRALYIMSDWLLEQGTCAFEPSAIVDVEQDWSDGMGFELSM
jgi:ankyrin repeat protein